MECWHHAGHCAEAKLCGLPGDLSLFTYMKKYGQKKVLHGERGGLTIWNITGIFIPIPGRKTEELIWEGQTGLKGHFRRQLSDSAAVLPVPQYCIKLQAVTEFLNSFINRVLLGHNCTGDGLGKRKIAEHSWNCRHKFSNIS